MEIPNTEASAPEIKLSDKNKSDFIKAMKIGYYKEFHRQGLITDRQLEQLIKLQNSTIVA